MVWAISPEPVERLRRYREQHGLDLTLLSDPELEVVRRYGITNPEQSQVPHPTAVVVDRAGDIRFLRVDEDYTRRPEAEELLDAVENLADKGPDADDQASGPGARALDWTLGIWTGVRRDGADGSEGALTMRVEPILDGAGHIRHVEVVHDGGVYRGFAVQVIDPRTGRWQRRYVNAVRARFASLEGETDGDRSVWRSTSPDRSRESRLVSDRLAPDRWRRTMSVSEDGGSTWRVLWTDLLVRAAASLTGTDAG